MGKRGPKPKGKVKIKWSSNFAYAIGLIASDGNLSSNKRHISFKVTDLELARAYRKCLGIEDIKISTIKIEGRKPAYRIQFGDVIFYNFLLKIGLMPKKSLILRRIMIPDKFYFDFLRGEFDGDGSSNSYWDKRWRSSFLMYLNFSSGSTSFLAWLQETTKKLANIKGHITSYKHSSKKNKFYQLKYAKKEAMVLYKKMYYNSRVVCLKRKKEKLEKAFLINKKQQNKYKLARVLEQ